MWTDDRCPALPVCVQGLLSLIHIFSSVTNAMKAGDKVALVGFGTFSVSERAARTGINPSTKAAIDVYKRQVNVRFSHLSLFMKCS